MQFLHTSYPRSLVISGAQVSQKTITKLGNPHGWFGEVACGGTPRLPSSELSFHMQTIRSSGTRCDEVMSHHFLVKTESRSTRSPKGFLNMDWERSVAHVNVWFCLCLEAYMRHTPLLQVCVFLHQVMVPIHGQVEAGESVALPRPCSLSENFSMPYNKELSKITWHEPTLYR